MQIDQIAGEGSGKFIQFSEELFSFCRPGLADLSASYMSIGSLFKQLCSCIRQKFDWLHYTERNECDRALRGFLEDLDSHFYNKTLDEYKKAADCDEVDQYSYLLYQINKLNDDFFIPGYLADRLSRLNKERSRGAFLSSGFHADILSSIFCKKNPEIPHRLDTSAENWLLVFFVSEDPFGSFLWDKENLGPPDSPDTPFLFARNVCSCELISV